MLFQSNWRHYLNIMLFLSALSFLTSGAITWVAANWVDFSKMEKFVLAQAALIVSIAVALWQAYRENSNTTKWKSLGLFFLSSVLIGGLFALFGQVYQTGADTWELFAYWSAAQLPLLLLFPNVALALLLVVTTNLASYFYFDAYDLGYSALNLVLLNGFWVILTRYLLDFFHDRYCIVLYTSSVLLAIALIASCFEDYVANIGILVAGGLFAFYYYFVKSDVLLKLLWFITLVAIFNIWFVIHFALGGLLFLPIVNIGALILLTQLELGMPEVVKHWINYIGKSLIALFVVTSIILSIALTSSFGVSGAILLFLSLSVFFTAYFSYGDNQQSNVFAEVVLLIGLLLALVGSNILDGLDNQQHALLGFVVGLIYSILIWWRTKATAWICICALALTFYQADQMLNWFRTFGGDWSSVRAIYFFVINITPVFCFWRTSQQESKVNTYLNIIGRACLLFVICNTLYIWFEFTPFNSVIAPEVPSETSFSEFFHAITDHLFIQESLLTIVMVLTYMVILPLTLLSLAKRYQMTKVQTALVIGLGLIVSFGFITYSMVSLTFSLLLLAYPLKDRTLFGTMLAWLLFLLWRFYYFLTIPLIYKSILLGVMGVIFLIGYTLLREKVIVYKVEAKKSYDSPMLKWKASIVASGTVALLVLFNQKIGIYEEVLASGKPIILQFVPRDPRSLMQGDYMEMHYQLNNEVQLQLNSSEIEYGKHYALLSTDNNGVAHLCRLEDSHPTNFEGCDVDVYIPMKIKGYWDITLPTHEYFFPEGKGEYFSQAEYAEYRFKNGKVLLYRLLDKDLKAL
ncbi:GDYXXLXY domain-containing protein [Actinobacillus capsulatus]|uniref:GDYXXLXY domain-containing protein n=1 Tax=Actinobacillus capsulatus TaxID=717 RepID=UPI00035FD5B5|nr:GDYXXLXY domain-containing protein [Actinobacillus capsulatus]